MNPIKFYDTITWSRISPKRKNALCKVFGLYSVSVISDTILEQIRANQQFCYKCGLCHQNSLLFAKYFLEQFDCYLVEGIAIRANGEAFMHWWNNFKTPPNANEQTEEEYDITHDLLMPNELPFLYFKTKEYNVCDIAIGADINFSDITKQKMDDYLTLVPDAQPLK